MDVAEFKRLIQIGHGRALLFLWENEDDTPYRDVILEACIHNQAVEPNSDVRGDYMRDAIEATGNPEFYAPHIITALLNLSDSADEYDVQQLYHMVWLLTFQGNTDARDAIYQRAAANIAQADFAGAYQVVRMDGLDGYTFAAEHIGRYMQGSDSSKTYHKYSIDSILIGLLEGRYGTLDYLAMLAQKSKENPFIATYVETVTALRRQRRKKSEDVYHWSYAQLQSNLQQNLLDLRWKLRSWGGKATESDISQAGADLLSQTDPEMLKAYLSIFGFRSFPFEPTLLFPFTRHPDGMVVRGAFEALEQIAHPLVREFALDMIQSGLHRGYAVGLLKENYQPGDWSLIEQLTAQPFDDLQNYHTLQLNVQQIARAHPGAESVGSLRNLYEFGPCAYCREHVVELLIEIGGLTNSMRAECEYDASGDTRRAVQPGSEEID